MGRRRRHTSTARRLGIACLLAGALGAGPAAATPLLDLADVVGGGSGHGTGTLGTGIHPATGAYEASPGGTTYGGDGAYHAVPSLAFVDGVFIPDGETQLDGSAAHFFTFSTGNQAHDHIEFGPHEGSGNFQTIAGVDYTAGDNTMIGLHANKGITFDLDAIRAANPGLAIERFTAVFGDDRFISSDPGSGDSDYRVFVDGVLRSSQLDMVVATAYPVDVTLAPTDRYLTLVATDGPSDSFHSDRVVVGNPRLTLVPEPAAAILIGAAALLLGSRRVRR